ncbi:MAG TPA: diaminopimelate decarboxylase [Terriglobales bacterium]|nr:diaminopimelate decarboxylase [Terriglobales bacterium]
MTKPLKPSASGRPPAFVYSGKKLLCEAVPVAQLAKRFGTPLYVYSSSTIRDRYLTFDGAFKGSPHTVCYSVKANSNLSILKLLASMGSGFDIVSGGELERVLRVDKKAAHRVVFSGVGKTQEEIDLALKTGILMFNIESEGEAELLGARASKLKKHARVALRVNPDVFAETHPYISTGLHKHKFGIPIADARQIYRKLAKMRYLDVAGISVHIGSQITSVDPFNAAMERLVELAVNLRRDGHDIRYIDCGGGLGIHYHGEHTDFAQTAQRYALAVIKPLSGLGIHLLLEPGRAIIGPCGALITRVLYRKRNGDKNFLVVDAGMNDLIRPSLYSAYHEIVPVELSSRKRETVDVVGPICETGDFFARDRELPVVGSGDLVALLDAGAYGMSISSNYNTRGRAAEVMVSGKQTKLVRRRETFDDQVRTESVR